MSRMTLAGVLAGAGLLSVSVVARATEVEFILEAFDGCGCQPLNPPNCPACHDLNGAGCNVHDGSTNDPHPAYCSSGGLPWPFPNADLYGPQSLDQDWWNAGYPVDYAGNNSTKNGVEPENQASQQFTVKNGASFEKIEAANMGYINPETPQEQVGGFGRMLLTQMLQDYNTLHPQAPKPLPDPTMPVWIAFDVLRAGDGFGSSDPNNPSLAMRADLIGVDHQPVPALAWTWMPDSERMVPNDNQWHTFRIGYFTGGLPEKVYMGIGIRLDASSRGFPTTTTQAVDVYIDNLRLIYTPLAQPEDCSNGFDDDLDGATDCADPDCLAAPGCPCNPVVIFDTDFDGDVDQADFAFLQTCLTGPGDPGDLFGSLDAACQCLDVAGSGGSPDQSLDQQDILAFEACASGPAVPADPACDD